MNLINLFKEFKKHKRLDFDNENNNDPVFLKENFLDKLHSEKLLHKELVNNQTNYSTSLKALKRVYILPSVITSLFSPLPPLMRKDYIFHLFLIDVNPYSFYLPECHEEIESYNLELQEILDNSQDLLEFKAFPYLSENIKGKNEHLYNLLEERNKYIRKDRLVTNSIDNEMSIVNSKIRRQIKTKRFNQIF